jgi:hypothetical protein
MRQDGTKGRWDWGQHSTKKQTTVQLASVMMMRMLHTPVHYSRDSDHTHLHRMSQSSPRDLNISIGGVPFQCFAWQALCSTGT